MSLLMHGATQVENAATHYEIMQRVARAIREDPTWDFTINQLMDHVHYRSRFHFSVVFRNVIGVPPIAYARIQRMKLAKQIIRTKSFNLGNVAIEVGYANHQGFTTAFKAEVGITPQMYRLRIREGLPLLLGTEGPVEPRGGIKRHSDLRL